MFLNILFRAFLRIPFVLNSELTYNLIFHINLASILIFSVGIMFTPWVALFICTLGSVLGEWMYCLIYGCGEETPVFLLFMVLSPGLAGALISVLRQKLKPSLINEIIAMIIGGIWQFVGLMIGAFVWYLGFLSFYLIIVFIVYPLYSTIFDLFLIPLSLLLNKGLRSAFNLKFFNDLLNEPIK